MHERLGGFLAHIQSYDTHTFLVFLPNFRDRFFPSKITGRPMISYSTRRNFAYKLSRGDARDIEKLSES